MAKLIKTLRELRLIMNEDFCSEIERFNGSYLELINIVNINGHIDKDAVKEEIHYIKVAINELNNFGINFELCGNMFYSPVVAPKVESHLIRFIMVINKSFGLYINELENSINISYVNKRDIKNNLTSLGRYIENLHQLKDSIITIINEEEK